MSHNPFLLETNLSKYFAQLLNISLDDDLSMMDMVEDLNSIENLADFRIFVKEKFNYERFRYLTGYQKFIALVNEYKKENAPKLDEESQIKVSDYSSKLFSLITSIMDSVNFELQTRGKTIDDLDFKKTLLSNGIKNHHIEVLTAIGDKKKIFHLSVYGKEELKARIESIVYRKAIIKQYPHLRIENKSDVQAKSLITQLKARA